MTGTRRKSVIDQIERRTFVVTAAGIGATALAGCSSDGTESGRFRLLISDQPTAIDSFDSLTVALSSARVFRADDDGDPTPAAVNGTVDEADDDDAENGVVEFDLDDESVDLTQVKGDRAVAVLEGELEEGRYSGIELRVTSAEGVVDSEDVSVMVPSNRLRIIRPFEIGGDDEVNFVFDINVGQKGRTGGYNLLPVIGKSGVAGRDVDLEEVTPENANE